jgi:hypothetical protein
MLTFGKLAALRVELLRFGKLCGIEHPNAALLVECDRWALHSLTEAEKIAMQAARKVCSSPATGSIHWPAQQSLDSSVPTAKPSQSTLQQAEL